MTKKERAEAQALAELHALLSTPSRILILRALVRRKAMAVQDIANELDMSHSAVSHQLGMLAAAGIVTYERSGRTILYRIGTSPTAKTMSKMVGK